jgi:hypothetical protein
MSNLLDPELIKVLKEDRKWLIETELPVVTVAGTFHEDLKRAHHLRNNNIDQDLVLSRAHFSMPIGLLVEAWGGKLDSSTNSFDHKTAWMVDPTNYLMGKKLREIQFTEAVGKILARQPILKKMKDIIDQFGRSKLPIVNNITPTLLYLTEEIGKPIISFHIAAGNVLAKYGRNVVQVVTDPHVRPEYTFEAGRPNTKYCVFDERTKIEFLEQAAIHNIDVDPAKVIVTGPPVGPRTRRPREKKVAWRSGPLNLCIATGGLGTNKEEIRQVLKNVLPYLRSTPHAYRFLVYAGTQKDIAEMVREVAKEEHVSIDKLDNTKATLRLIYHPQLFDSNELLIKYGFPWADGFITKPSGDMAYDAVASGSFLLTLEEWGIWEERVREVFEQKDISRRADAVHLIEQLKVLQQAPTGQSWVEKAMNHALNIEKLFLLGNQNIIKVAEKWRKELEKKESTLTNRSSHTHSLTEEMSEKEPEKITSVS